MAIFSKTQIDRLGDRLRKGSPSEADLKLLDEYRRSFGDVYTTVIRTIRETLELEPTGRPAKSTRSIVEKLRRESIRLSQIQDIAGCRVVVGDIVVQDQKVAALRAVFPDAKVIDRRVTPNFGYRAVHVIVEKDGKSVEVQVRSSLQHLWAELSERLSDVVDSSIKYGGGDKPIRELLTSTSQLVNELEKAEQDCLQVQGRLYSLQERVPADQHLREEVIQLKLAVVDALDKTVRCKDELIQLFQHLTPDVDNKRNREQ